MQEGDKLELTDIEEKEESGDDTKDGNSDEDSENDEKEAESKCDCGCSIGECKCPEGCKCGCGDHDAEYEAVQAKVTRPVKEEEEEVKDDEEGGVDLGTIAKVGAVGLGAVVLGSLLTAEDESDYWAGENAHWRAEGGNADSTVVWELIQQNLNNPDTVRLYYSVIVGDPDEYEGDDMATTVAEAFQQNWRNEDFVNHISKELGFEAEGSGQIDLGTQTPERTVEALMRYDHNWADYAWKLEGDVTDEEREAVEDLAEDTIMVEDTDDAEGWYDDEFEFEGRDVRVDWHKSRDDGRFYGLAAEGEDFQKMTPSEYVPFDQMQEELGQMWDETTAPLADAHNYDYEPSNEPSNANFSAEAEYVCEECDEPLHEDEVEWNVHYQDIDRLKQRIANGESAKNVIEDCHGVEYRVCENHKSNWREELMDYERRLYETETFEAGKHSGRRSKRKKRGMGSLSSSRRNKQTNEWRPFDNRIKSRKETTTRFRRL